MTLRADLLWQGERADAKAHLAAIKARMQASHSAAGAAMRPVPPLTREQSAERPDTFLDDQTRLSEE